MLGAAFEYAFAHHQGQTDKAGQPYIAHLVRVAARVTDPVDQVVALLHDVVEDTAASRDDVAALFGEDVAVAVAALTKIDGEPLEAYIGRVRQNPRAMRVKAADLADNSDPQRLALLPRDMQDRLVAKYDRARALLACDGDVG